MTSHLIKIAASLALLAGSAAVAGAQPGSGPGPMMQGPMMQGPPGAGEGARQAPPDAYDDRRRGAGGWRHGWRGDRDWGPRHMRGHMMGPGMMRLMIILMDTDGDGALSLEEVQAVHARIFRAIDADGDNRVTPEEIQAFFASLHGRPSGPQEDGQGPAQQQ
jgi:hypothetical protein